MNFLGSLVLGGLLFPFSVASFAAYQNPIVDHGDFLTDTSTQLDWLDVTKSVNMSFAFVNSQFGAGGVFEGWRYATSAEFQRLINDFTRYEMPNGSISFYLDEIDGLVQMLGSTIDSYWMSEYGVTLDASFGYPEGGYLDSTAGVLGDAPPPGVGGRLVGLLEDNDSGSFADFAQIKAFQFSTSPSIGSYLVRSASVQGVPEPTSFTLIGIGLAAMAFRRKCRPDES